MSARDRWIGLIGLVWILLLAPFAWAGGVTYEYDNLGRLTGVIYDDGSQITYTYDANGNRLSSEIVGGGPLAITTTSLADATQGQAYTAQLRARGGAQPYGWSLGAGALPAGLSLNRPKSSDAVIWGNSVQSSQKSLNRCGANSV